MAGLQWLNGRSGQVKASALGMGVVIAIAGTVNMAREFSALKAEVMGFKELYIERSAVVDRRDARQERRLEIIDERLRHLERSQ